MDIANSVGGFWLGRTKNGKTDDVPTLWVGETRQESFDSCKGCSQLQTRSCYAQFGTPAMGHSSMVRAAARGKTYAFEAAMAARSVGAKMARFGAIGDPSRIAQSTLARWIYRVREEGLSVVGYTHHWREKRNGWLRDSFMASCDSIEEADEAFDKGWRPACVAPSDHAGGVTTPKGRKLIVCPAIAAERKGRKVTCNACRLCDVEVASVGVIFPDHGPKRTKRTK